MSRQAFVYLPCKNRASQPATQPRGLFELCRRTAGLLLRILVMVAAMLSLLPILSVLCDAGAQASRAFSVVAHGNGDTEMEV